MPSSGELEEPRPLGLRTRNSKWGKIRDQIYNATTSPTDRLRNTKRGFRSEESITRRRYTRIDNTKNSRVNYRSVRASIPKDEWKLALSTVTTWALQAGGGKLSVSDQQHHINKWYNYQWNSQDSPEQHNNKDRTTAPTWGCNNIGYCNPQ
eukprot:12338240-Heterocapsa_arctica.AAC.1